MYPIYPFLESSSCWLTKIPEELSALPEVRHSRAVRRPLDQNPYSNAIVGFVAV